MTSLFWVVMTDLDLFKKVDDTFGHEAGDNVLKTFADTLRIHTRQPGICTVWGGACRHKKDTETAVERIHKHFADAKFTFEGSIFAATASFGIPGFRGTKPAD
jgi:diguanylate cyclase (GGDEF)-like protein